MEDGGDAAGLHGSGFGFWLGIQAWVQAGIYGHECNPSDSKGGKTFGGQSLVCWILSRGTVTGTSVLRNRFSQGIPGWQMSVNQFPYILNKMTVNKAPWGPPPHSSKTSD